MINFQSRIHIYKPKFFFINFFVNSIFSRIFRIDSDKNKLKESLCKKFHTKNIHLVGQCREGIYYAVKYSILTTKRKEVIVSSYTLYHVINMIILAGGVPVFIDLDKNSFQNSYKDVVKKINKSTACVILTHLFDINHEIEKIKNYTNNKKVFLIEDCAVSHGIKNSRNLESGRFGDVGVLSFQAMKNVQSLMGGAIISNNQHFSEWIEGELSQLKETSFNTISKKLMFVFCVDFLTRIRLVNFIFFQILKFAYKKNIGTILKFIRADHLPTLISKYAVYNFTNMTNTQAKFINLGLINVDRDNQIRLEKAKIYHNSFQDLKDIKILPKINFNNQNHLEFPIICGDKNELFNFLLENNIDARKFYYRNLASLDCYKNFKTPCKNAKEIESKVITLPCHPNYSKKNIYRAIHMIKLFYYNKNKSEKKNRNPY